MIPIEALPFIAFALVYLGYRMGRNSKAPRGLK